MGQRDLSVIERCLYYGGRTDRLKFGISGTKGTVRRREVSVLQRSRLHEDRYLQDRETVRRREVSVA